MGLRLVIHAPTTPLLTLHDLHATSCLNKLDRSAFRNVYSYDTILLSASSLDISVFGTVACIWTVVSLEVVTGLDRSLDADVPSELKIILLHQRLAGTGGCATTLESVLR